VHAGIRNVEALVVDEDDPHVNPIGAKGLGELPIVGVAAARANAVYNATGRRIRELPITAEKLLV
jgi:xanthine dehydrogenase YagR molybdenum-binding subunit